MSDKRERDLERQAALGDAAADQRLMCYRIQKLGLELPIDPDIFKTITLPGVYAGQAVAEKDGMQHPCLKWHRGNMVEYYDLRSGWKIKSEMTHFVRSRQSGQTAALRRAARSLAADAAEDVEGIARVFGIDVEVSAKPIYTTPLEDE